MKRVWVCDLLSVGSSHGERRKSIYFGGMDRLSSPPTFSSSTRTGLVAYIAAAVLLGILMLSEGSDSQGLARIYADDSGTLIVTPSHANADTIITVTVDDSSLGTTGLNQNESTDFTGNPYELPPGGASEQHIFRVANGPIADLNGDGLIDGGDIQVTVPNVGLSWVSTQTGTFSVTRFVSNPNPIQFQVTYRNEVMDVATVDVRSSSDIDGFELTLRETGMSTNLFTATFSTGDETSTTNLGDPAVDPRPTIFVEDGGIVTIEYADESPPTLISDAVIIDTTLPELVVTQPENGVTTSTAQTWFSVDATDDRSGLELSDIAIHVDIDQDGIFDEEGEILTPSELISAEINQGWAAFAQITDQVEDGTISWYATATDRAGNTGRTDSDPETEGDQDHTYVLDTRPPAISAVLLGDDYNDELDRELTNRPGMVRVDFSEDIDPESIVAGRFILGDKTPVAAVVYEDLPASVFLEYEPLSSIAEPMTILAGAVKDVPGLTNEQIIKPVTDRLGPTLEVLFDTVITNDKVEVTTRSPEELAAAPTIEINGVTFGALEPTGNWLEWTTVIDDDFLTGSALGDGVKNVEIAGFDKLGNRAHGGVSREDPAWPEGAHLYELDRVIKKPTVLPAANDTVVVTNPVITVSYSEEPAEYVGDSHDSVTIIAATLDGFDVTSLMIETSATTWSFQPSSLTAGIHEFIVQGRDNAGNIHGASTLVFTVNPTDQPLPTITPTPEATPTQIGEASPGATLPPGQFGSPTPEPTIEPTVDGQPTPEPVPTATPDAATVEPTPTIDPAPTPTPEGSVDVEATVQAIRNGDSEGGGDDPVDPLDPQPAYTLYGCGLPVGHSGVAGGDYLIMGAGLVGLIFMSRRRKKRGSD